MPRHRELPPAAARRQRRRRPWSNDHHRLVVIDDNEADLLARAYAAHQHTREEWDT